MSSSVVNKMANLLCSENTEVPRGIEDPVLGREAVGQVMVHLQSSTTPPFNYFALQSNIFPFMRKVVANWMHAVCLEQKCEDTIFPLAMNFFDRFLCTTNVLKSQLQLVGAVCMFLATKMRQTNNLPLHILSEYTEFSVSCEEIQQWELVVVTKLGWDLSPPIPNDFIDYILVRCQIPLSKHSLLRRHALTMVALTLLDEKSITLTASLIAAGALGAAARNIGSDYPSETVATIIYDDPINVEEVISIIEELLEASVTSDANKLSESPQSPSTSPVPEEYSSQVKPFPDENDSYDGNETPSDVVDITY